ncbi:hypothetical protein OIU35_31440 [Boseaceae bacterium BT-24-1]|nr:hypothetical protein [Boseaceae bacterium BT-24-1]
MPTDLKGLEVVARAIYEAMGYAYAGRTINAAGGAYGEWRTACIAADAAILAYESAKPKETDTLHIRAMLAAADEDDLYREIANRLGASWTAPNGRSYGPAQPRAMPSAAGDDDRGYDRAADAETW